MLILSFLRCFHISATDSFVHWLLLSQHHAHFLRAVDRLRAELSEIRKRQQLLNTGAFLFYACIRYFSQQRHPPSPPPAHSFKPVLNWSNVCSPEHTSDTSTNYDSFLNWTFSSPNMVRTVQTLLHSQLACNEMQASAADSMIENAGSSQVNIL